MKSNKLIRITYWVFIVAALILAASFAICIMHYYAIFEDIESTEGEVHTIAIYNCMRAIMLTGAGLFFILRTLVVLRRGFLFDIQLGKLFIVLAILNIVLTIATYVTTHLAVSIILPGLSMPVLILLISIIYWVGANLEKENSLTV